MEKKKISVEDLEARFESRKVMDLDEVKNALNTRSTMSVFRKLKRMSYLTSYSHRGKYYTLRDIAEFDEKGLWFHHSVRFSEFGTLLDTAEVFVDISEIGYTARELGEELKVDVQETLLRLFKKGKVSREKATGVYVYLSADSAVKERQFLLRRKIESVPAEGLSLDALNQELKAGIVLFFSLLDERQRRLYAGLEAFKLGHGGDSRIADLLGLDVHTVAKGRQELFSRDFDAKRVRKKGGGRKPTEKKSPK
ncbi:MAG: hypothetical protein GY866_10685 [Proteobacteria bacterium]|nr:hypothetical protein [Pseudomonadota bacterium]